jgi:hypothetical protein
MALTIGFCLVAALGVAHHFALRGLDLVSGSEKRGWPNLSLIGVFIGLLIIHTLEILAFAAVYRVLLDWSWMGDLTGEFDRSWSGLIYFSGINFATLGYTQIETSGPIRMINMMQSLGGFMILTWSATFIYAAWNQAFKQ